MASQTIGGVGRDGGPVALALTLGSADLGAAVPTTAGQGTTPFVLLMPDRVCLSAAAKAPRAGRAGWRGPKRATTTVPGAMHTWVA